MSPTDAGGSSPGYAGASSARRWLALLLGVAVTGFTYTLVRRGLVLSDEGFLLLQSWDMAQGKVLYRDMDSFVAPGVWFLLSTLFRIFEPSVFVSRMAVLVCFLATVAVCARIVERLADGRYALAAVGAFLVICVWGFPAWTWSFYSIYAVLFAMAALERLLAWRASSLGRDLVWVGVFLGLSITFKQNYGAQVLVGAVLAAVAIRVELDGSIAAALRAAPAASLRVALGMACVGLPVLAYFGLHGALPDLFRALVLHPFTSFLGHHAIPYLPPTEFVERDLFSGWGRMTYGAYGLNHGGMRFLWPRFLVRGVELLHVLLYWLPPIAFAAGGAFLLRSLRQGRLDGGLAALLAVGGSLFLGVFPRADLNHLVNVYQPVIVVAAVVLARFEGVAAGLPRGLRRGVVGAGATLAVLYTGLAVYWYFDIRSLLSEELAHPRAGVLLSSADRQMIDYEVGQIRARTRPGEPVLTLPAMSMLNFLAERPMPSRYYNHYAAHIGHDGGEELVRQLEENEVRWVLADYYGFFSEAVGMREYAPRLTEYLRRYFAPADSVGIDSHLFLVRRRQPLPERERSSVLGDCDVGFFDWRSRGLQQHLLFDSLYHPLQSGGLLLRRQVETQCRVSVPEGAVLAFAVGYRQPTRVSRGTQLAAEVWLRADAPGAAYERVYREAVQPLPVQSWSSPPHQGRRIDLSRWGGQDVWLLFRTRFDGDARMNNIDFKGFAMIWQDPQLESGDGGGAAR